MLHSNICSHYFFLNLLKQLLPFYGIFNTIMIINFLNKSTIPFSLWVSQLIAIFFLVCCDHVLWNKVGECAQSYCVIECGGFS